MTTGAESTTTTRAGITLEEAFQKLQTTVREGIRVEGITLPQTFQEFVSKLESKPELVLTMVMAACKDRCV